MITFEGKPQVLKSAEILERNAKNLYPHISTSRIKTHLDTKQPIPNFYAKLADNIVLSRQMIRESKDLYSSVLFALQEFKLGNCTEEAILAEMLGKINGQNNIYSGCIFINKNGFLKRLDHAVAFVTNKKIDGGKDYLFKNKDAIIIDPWLGITDCAGSYFGKIKSIFRDTFKNLQNNDLEMAIIKSETKTPKEFNDYRRKHGSKINFNIIPFKSYTLKNTSLDYLKDLFPELTFKNFKKIELPPSTKSKSIEK